MNILAQARIVNGVTLHRNTFCIDCVSQVVVTNPVYREPQPDSSAQIIFSCLVIWCCFACLGIPAFIIASECWPYHDNTRAYQSISLYMPVACTASCHTGNRQ